MNEQISATIPDWNREKPRYRWEPGARLLQSIRGYQKWKKRGGVFGWALSKIFVLKHRFWSIVSGAEVPLNCLSIAGGLQIPHPNGIVIHPDAVIGPNCLILQQVTLGAGGKIPGYPKIGGHVDIGAGAKLLGGVVIGDNAQIGANTVVLCHVPEGATAVGVPARIIEKNQPDMG